MRIEKGKDHITEIGKKRKEIIKKIRDRTDWFKRRGNIGVLKIPATPDSILATRIKTRIKHEVPSKKVMIQELLGGPLGDRVVSSSEPW